MSIGLNTVRAEVENPLTRIHRYHQLEMQSTLERYWDHQPIESPEKSLDEYASQDEGKQLTALICALAYVGVFTLIKVNPSDPSSAFVKVHYQGSEADSKDPSTVVRHKPTWIRMWIYLISRRCKIGLIEPPNGASGVTIEQVSQLGSEPNAGDIVYAIRHSRGRGGHGKTKMGCNGDDAPKQIIEAFYMVQIPVEN